MNQEVIHKEIGPHETLKFSKIFIFDFTMIGNFMIICNDLIYIYFFISRFEI